MLAVAKSDAVSPSNALGMFEMTTRRLIDLGVLQGAVRRVKGKSGRTLWASGDPKDHQRALAFLKNRSAQYDAFVRSMCAYAEEFRVGKLKVPDGWTLSGALAVCHRAGSAGLEGERFSHTEEARLRAEGIF